MSEIAKQLRATWPLSADFGPVTSAQRILANQAADCLDEICEACSVLLETSDARVTGVSCVALNMVRDALSKARGVTPMTEAA